MKPRYANRCLLAASVLAMCPWGVIAQVAEPPQPQGEEQALPRLFVSDKLVLNVYAQPDQGSARVATIETGDAVAQLESGDDFVRVRLGDGREGWVGASYLTSEMPAAARLRELQREQKSAVAAAEKQSAEEIARLKKETAALQMQVKALEAGAAKAATASTVVPEDTPPSEPIAIETDRAPRPTTQAPATAPVPAWIWPFAVVLGLVAGFAAGYQTLARRIRKRFGRLKIY